MEDAVVVTLGRGLHHLPRLPPLAGGCATLQAALDRNRNSMQPRLLRSAFKYSGDRHISFREDRKKKARSKEIETLLTAMNRINCMEVSLESSNCPSLASQLSLLYDHTVYSGSQLETTSFGLERSKPTILKVFLFGIES